MKLAQKYNNTLVEGEYRKRMLSSAHILAMDAKNLLDVVDTIRINYPSVEQLFLSGTSSSSISGTESGLSGHCLSSRPCRNSTSSGSPSISTSSSAASSLEKHKDPSSPLLLHRGVTCPSSPSLQHSSRASPPVVSLGGGGGTPHSHRHNINTNVS